MPLSELKVTGIRNLKDSHLDFSKDINFIYGMNGGGKTSILEAIYFLSTGRSFRTHKTINLINHNKSEFTLFGIAENEKFSHRLGINKSRFNQTKIRIDRIDATSSSQLAHILPTIIIDPNSFSLLGGAPQLRRKFLDWGVFHVEHSFSKIWSEYNSCLKQRNNLLKNYQIDHNQLKVWNVQLALRAEKIEESRNEYFKKFQVVFNHILKSLDESLKINIKYKRGWHDDIPFLEFLSANLEHDIKSKFTVYGPHRADLKILIERQIASELLSRGQQKLVSFALLLAQLETFEMNSTKSAILLIDDINSELDDVYLRTLLNKVYNSRSQLFISSISKIDFQRFLPVNKKNMKLFHVEHGCITEDKHASGALIND